MGQAQGLAPDQIDWLSSDSVCILSPGWTTQECEHFSRMLEVGKSQAAAGETLIWLASSGSTGQFPSLIGLSKKGFLESASSVVRTFRLGSADSWALALPHWHVGGLAVLARAHLQGAKVFHWNEKWQAQNFFEYLVSHSCAVVSLVPTQLFDLVQLKLRAPKSLKLVFIGGASLDQSLCDQALSLGWPLVSSYGMTESSSMVAINDLRTLHPVNEALRLGSFEVLPHWKAKLDTESSVLCLRGSGLFRIKVKLNVDSSVAVESIPFDSWWSTSDRVQLINETQFFWLGRADDFIKIKGEGVVLSQVLASLRRMVESLSGIQGLSPQQIVGVLPVESDRRGFRLFAVVEAPTLNKEWGAFLREFNSKAPSHERVHGFINRRSWTKSELGKLKQQEARDYILAHQSDWQVLE